MADLPIDVETGITIVVPGALRMHCGGAGELRVQATTVRAALDAVRVAHAALVQHILTRDGELRPFVKLFVRNSDVRDLHGLDTPLHAGDIVTIVPSVAGG